MQITPPFGRLITAMVTPFSKSGEIDWAGLEKIAAHLVSTGHDGIAVNGTTGEAPTTSDDEKDQIIKAVRKVVGDKIKIIAGAGNNETSHSVEQAQRAAKAGADGLLVVTPYYNKPPQAGIEAHFRAMADATDLPVMMYDIPGRTGVEIESDTIVKLAEHKNIAALKDAKGNLAGFFFYETYDGFKFKSIDKLFRQDPKRKLIFNNIIESSPPEGYDIKILDYYFDSTFDLKKSLVTGDLFNTKLKAVNAYESAYRENGFDYKSQELVDNLGGKEFPLVAFDLKAQEQITRISYKWDDPGFLVPGKDLLTQLLKSTYINYSNDEILRQSYVRYNNLFNVKIY